MGSSVPVPCGCHTRALKKGAGQGVPEGESLNQGGFQRQFIFRRSSLRFPGWGAGSRARGRTRCPTRGRSLRRGTGAPWFGIASLLGSSWVLQRPLCALLLC